MCKKSERFEKSVAEKGLERGFDLDWSEEYYERKENNTTNGKRKTETGAGKRKLQSSSGKLWCFDCGTVSEKKEGVLSRSRAIEEESC